MIQQAIEYIKALAIEGFKTQVIPAPGKKNAYYVTTAAGTEITYGDIPSEHHVCTNLESLVAIAQGWAGVGDHAESVNVWVHDTAVKVTFADACIDDTAVLQLEKTAQMILLETCFGWSINVPPSVKWHKPDDLALALELCFSGDEAVSEFVAQLRNLTFAKNEMGHVHATLGRRSVGKTLTAEVGSHGQLPSEVSLRLSVYKQNDHQVSVAAKVLYDAEKESVAIAPYANSFSVLRDEAQTAINRRIIDILCRSNIDDSDIGRITIYRGIA